MATPMLPLDLERAIVSGVTDALRSHGLSIPQLADSDLEVPR